MLDALLFGVLAAAVTYVAHPLLNRLLGKPRPEQGLLIGSTSIVFGAVFGAIFADEVFGIHWGGAFVGAAIGFVVAAIMAGIFRR